MKLCKKIFRIASLAFIILMLGSSSVLAAYSYYVTVQVQETGSNSYDYLPIITDIDNDYLADNGYISLTGLDTRILSGTTELEHLVTDDKTLFVIPSVEADSTGNYRYTLGNSLLSDFPIITGVDGYITIADDADLELADDFEIEWKGYVNTDAGADKNLLSKDAAFLTYIQAEDAIRVAIMKDPPSYPTVVATNGGNDVVNQTDHTVNLPAGINAGDMLIVYFATDTNTSITFPGGWENVALYSDGANVSMRIAYRIADGTEGATITVTTGNAQMTAHTSHRITGHSGIPKESIQDSGADAAPDPPSLTAPWGSTSNLWIAVCAYEDGQATVNAYPANYVTDNRNDRSNDAEGVGIGISSDEVTAATEDPGAYTLSAGKNHIAGTIVVKPDLNEENTVATVTGVDSGEMIVIAEADGANLELSVTDYDLNHLGNSPQSTALAGDTVPGNAYDWTLDETNVMPYMEYYKHTTAVGGVSLKAWYQPISMIVGTNLDDREGTDAGETGAAEEDGTITWGANPADLSATVGSLISSDQPEVSPASEEGAVDVVPEGEVPVDGGVVNTTKLQDNPLYPIVQIVNEYTGYTEEQIWFTGATIIIFIGMGIAVIKVPNHLLLGGTIGLVLGGFFTAMEIYQWWMMLIFGFMFFMSILMERKPAF